MSLILKYREKFWESRRLRFLNQGLNVKLKKKF